VTGGESRFMLIYVAVSAASSARNSSTYSRRRLRSNVTGKKVASLSPQRLSQERMVSSVSEVILIYL
jgi:hypothetical protein